MLETSETKIETEEFCFFARKIRAMSRVWPHRRSGSYDLPKSNKAFTDDNQTPLDDLQSNGRKSPFEPEQPVTITAARAMDRSAAYGTSPLSPMPAPGAVGPANGSRRRNFVAVGILLLINLLNYMDRFTVSGVLTQLQEYFDMNDAQAGLLQTVFISFYMLFAPICGYLGDRFNRKIIMAVGLIIWLIAVFTSTLVHRHHFYLFLFCRGVVGIGEASYSMIAPTIIADMFTGSARSVALMVFYFAIPVGSGLGYMTGSSLALWTGQWQWGVRATPLMGIVCVLLLIFVLEEPERGYADGAQVEQSTFCQDIRYLMGIRTYVWSTIGFTAVVFVTGCLGWWTPTVMQHAWAMNHGTSDVPSSEKASINLIFGVIMSLAGLIGVTIGSTVAEFWRDGRSWLKPNHRADAYVCAIGAFLGVPALFAALQFAAKHLLPAYVCIFIGVTSMCLNWAVNTDMTMYIVVPNRRATATAFSTLISHLFGDATSPYIVGAVSDALRGNDTTPSARFFSLQTALYIPNFVLIFGGAFYLLASFTVVKDRRAAEQAMHVTSKWDPDNEEPLPTEHRQPEPGETALGLRNTAFDDD